MNHKLRTNQKAFTLLEVLLALTVFVFAVTGLALALDSMIQAALEARERVFSRLELESRIAYNMVDPPLSGNRTLTAEENHGVAIDESCTPEELQDNQGQSIPGIYRLKISSKMGKVSDTAEVLLHPLMSAF